MNLICFMHLKEYNPGQEGPLNLQGFIRWLEGKYDWRRLRLVAVYETEKDFCAVAQEVGPFKARRKGMAGRVGALVKYIVKGEAEF